MVDDHTGKTTHDASTITVLEGLEAVRKRPGMYIGPTGERGLRHLVYTVLDSAVNEALAGCASNAHVTMLADGGVRVADDGCGIPVDAIEPDGRPSVEVVLTTLRGGRFHTGPCCMSQGGLYHVSWIYGLGLPVVNALSERLEVEVRRQGHVQCR